MVWDECQSMKVLKLESDLYTRQIDRTLLLVQCKGYPLGRFTLRPLVGFIL